MQSIESITRGKLDIDKLPGKLELVKGYKTWLAAALGEKVLNLHSSNHSFESG